MGDFLEDDEDYLQDDEESHHHFTYLDPGEAQAMATDESDEANVDALFAQGTPAFPPDRPSVLLLLCLFLVPTDILANVHHTDDSEPWSIPLPLSPRCRPLLAEFSPPPLEEDLPDLSHSPTDSPPSTPPSLYATPPLPSPHITAATPAAMLLRSASVPDCSQARSRSPTSTTSEELADLWDVSDYGLTSLSSPQHHRHHHHHPHVGARATCAPPTRCCWS